jgi:hypothetical protein
MNLIEHFSQIKDFRRKQGQRYPLEAILLIITMGVMSGFYRYREIDAFAKANKKTLLKHLKIKKKILPSYVTIREIIMNIDFDSLNEAFYKWTKDYVSISEKEWLCVDGKAIKSTVEDCDNAYQNFVSLVSIFSQKRGQVIKATKYENKKVSEVSVVQELLSMLDLKDVVFTFDAMHCKKNSSNHYRPTKRLPGKGKRQSAQTI